jgi:predicted RNA-binding protein with PUA-like domain
LHYRKKERIFTKMSNAISAAPQCWLFKSEPEEFSIDHLAKLPNQTAPWTGIRNYQSRNTLRDAIKVGDRVFFYHSSTKVKGVAGICEVVKSGYPDPTAFDKMDPYYDPKSSPANPVWVAVDIRLVRKFDQVVTLELMKKTTGLENVMVCRQGARLSIQPVSLDEWRVVESLAAAAR